MTALLLTRCPALHAEVSRLAAAAGIEPRVLDDPVDALAEWSSAQVVLVGDDVADDLAAVGPGRRGDVHVVGISPADAVFRAAVWLGAESVLDVAAAGDHLVELLTDVGEPAADGRLVGVVGGAGGVGATTLACALAQAGAEGSPTLLVDTDPLGPGLDRLLGLEECPGVRWDELHATSGRLGARALRESVPRDDGPGVLTWSGARGSLDPTTLRETLSAARRGHDLVVVDLARHGGATTIELVGRCDAVLVVAPATLAGVASTARLVAALGGLDAPAGLVLRPGDVSHHDAAAATGLEVVHELGHQRGIAQSVDLGLGPLTSRRGPLARAVRILLPWTTPRAPRQGTARAGAAA